jgi:hypothetical protein
MKPAVAQGNISLVRVGFAYLVLESAALQVFVEAFIPFHENLLMNHPTSMTATMPLM